MMLDLERNNNLAVLVIIRRMHLEDAAHRNVRVQRKLPFDRVSDQTFLLQAYPYSKKHNEPDFGPVQWLDCNQLHNYYQDYRH